MIRLPVRLMHLLITILLITLCACNSDPDKDMDDDGIVDTNDNCVAIANPQQEDQDGDLIGDACDNCPSIYNPRQEKTDCPSSSNVVKVFILMGQSNMVGQGDVTPTPEQLANNGGMGTLKYLVEDSSTASIFSHLVTPSGDWVERDDVWIADLNHAGPLTVNGNTIGPELQFGHTMGDYYENPVLIIKASWGGKSLHVDFRPPSSGGDIGPFYTEAVDRVHDVLNNIEQYMPDYEGQGFEIAGIGWHQGWNDRINQEFNDAYQINGVNLINDLRDEFKLPELPFVLATTGMTGWDETHPRALSLMEAQLAIPADGRLKSAKVRAVETRDYYRESDVSPANESFHWNRNAETYFLIGKGMGEAMRGLLQSDLKANIEGVFFAQTHVQDPNDALFKLVSKKAALIKVHVVSPDQGPAPGVSATLQLDDTTLTLPLRGPNLLPASIPIEPGVVQHRNEDSFTAMIPGEWVRPGLSLVVNVGDKHLEFNNLKIGAPSKVIMTMFDMHYFKYSPGDYSAGWKEELEAKWPVAELEVRRLPEIVFNELVIPPRPDIPVRAVRVTSKEDYKAQTGLNFDGEQAAALHWNSALKAAAGTRGRISLYYANIYGVHAGGQAGGFGGVGNGTHDGVLSHELGHALSLPHWGNNANYPYRGEMFGIPAPTDETHVGPTWAFDLPTKTFIPPTVQENSTGGTFGTYKADPMQGGGNGDQEKNFIFRHFSDYSVNQMRAYLEEHVLIWNENLGSYAHWNTQSENYTSIVANNGIWFPVERDVNVVSVMAAVSAATPEVNMVYPPIGPYIAAGIIDLFDPNNAEDRARADSDFCPSDGCDVSLRIVQGGIQKTYMLAISWDPSIDPLGNSAMRTRALNLRSTDGDVTRVELLLTPDSEKNGLSSNPQVLDSWVK